MNGEVLMAEKKSNVLLYIGIGCAVIILLGGILLVGLSFLGVKKFKELEADIKNPGPKALELLGTAELPAGYNAQLALPIPFVMDLVIISNGEPMTEDRTDGDQDMGTEGLFYFKLAWGGEKDQELQDYFDGKTDDPRALREANIDIDTQEIIKRGVLDLNGQTLNYVVQRGNVQTSGNTQEGLNALFLIHCDGDEKMRFGIRYGEDPNPDMPASDLDLTQTIADEDNLREFLGHFTFCK